MKAKVFVTLKKDVLDPQGTAVARSLNSLGYNSLEKCRIGKYIELELNEEEYNSAYKIVDSMCVKMLANPIIENYKIEILENEKKI